MKLKILLVDDEYEKAQSIAMVANRDGSGICEIEHASTANAARIALRQSGFDLLLIDLNLPSTMGAAPSKDGGLRLFDMLTLDNEVNLPADVLFITGREELADYAEQETTKRGVQLCRYNSSDEQWKRILDGKVRYLAQRLTRREASTYPKIDVAIVTALRKPELEAALRLQYGWRQFKVPGDASTYQIGQIPKSTGQLSVLAVSAHRKGMPSSAALVSKVCALFRPKYLVMLGICAGVRNRTNLGDVIVADPSWDWGSGKQAEDAKGSPVFLAAPYQRPLNTHISQVAVELSDKPEVIAAIRGGWQENAPAGKLKIHVGPMASGASVLADDRTITGITTQHRELLAVEMEAYAVMAAAEYANTPVPIAIAIKSVCDYADSEKNDTWQEYASYTSASFFDQMFRNESVN